MDGVARRRQREEQREEEEGAEVGRDVVPACGDNSTPITPRLPTQTHPVPRLLS